MALCDRTKRLFADTLKEMVKTIPFEKVRVKELCERCGADRQTFYYHFRDKYDLAAWIFARDYEESLSDTDGRYSLEHAAGILQRIRTSETFYKKAFSDRSQNAVSRYVYDYFVSLGTEAACRFLDTDRLDTVTIYAIKSHSFACVGHTVEWLEGKTNYSPLEFASLQYRFMPKVLKEAYGIPVDDAGDAR